jgi:glyoxylase-like metal-dependent hydrolase (beta-lactamase superfamily II)
VGSSPTVGKPMAEGIGRISGFVNSYTYREGDETFLIDTGFARRAKPILRAFQQANVSIAEVKRVLLTHHHVDHMGGAAYLVQNTHAPLSCHGEDAEFVEGRVKAPMPLLMRLFVRVHPAPVAVMLKEGDRVGSLVVLHVPGHTPGEVALYHPERKILFSGDSVVEQKGRLTLPGARFASNMKQAVESLGRLRSLDVELLLPGHGVPVTTNFGALLDDLVRRAPAEFLGRSPS